MKRLHADLYWTAWFFVFLMTIALAGCQSQSPQATESEGKGAEPIAPFAAYLQVRIANRVRLADYEQLFQTSGDTAEIVFESVCPGALLEGDLRQRIHISPRQPYGLSINAHSQAILTIPFAAEREIKLSIDRQATQKGAIELPRDLKYTFRRVDKRTMQLTTLTHPETISSGDLLEIPSGARLFTLTFSHPASRDICSQRLGQLSLMDLRWTDDQTVTFVYDLRPNNGGLIEIVGLEDVHGVTYEPLSINLRAVDDVPIMLIDNQLQLRSLTTITRQAIRATISPDGSQLVYAKERPTTGDGNPASLWIRELASGEEHQLFGEVSCDGNDMGVFWQPVGNRFWVAAGSSFYVGDDRDVGESVYLCDSSGSVKAIPLNLPSNTRLGSSAVSPVDGSLILYLINTDPSQVSQEGHFSYLPVSLRIYAPDGSNYRDYRDLGYHRAGLKPIVLRPAAHPDGKSVLFSGSQIGENEQWLYGTIQVDLITGKTSMQQEIALPNWSPTGQHYAIGETVYDAAGRNVGSASSWGVWSPDGRRFAYTGHDDRGLAVIVYDLNTQQKKQWPVDYGQPILGWTNDGLVIWLLK